MSDIKLIKTKTKELLDFYNIKSDVNVSEGEEIVNVKITGDDLNFLIGTRGRTLDSLQNVLSSSVFNALGEWTRINVDINEYKLKKEEKIKDMVKRYIDKVRFFQKDVSLPPMNPWERRLVHMFVSEYSDVSSESKEEGIQRHVVISAK